MPTGSQNADEGHLGVTSNGSLNELNRHTITELCQRAFFDIIVSEKFAALCKLLFENFPGVKVDRFFDYNRINTKMEEGAYEHSPVLFSSDIQEVWSKLQRIGTDMVSLAKSLSDISSTSYCEQVGGSVYGTSEDGKHEFCTQGFDCHAKPEQSEACGVYKVGTCRHCREKADVRDCLICDSCEEMYHVSCIEPAVKEIPPKTWYCGNCTASGVGLPHENCIVCERLNAPKSLLNGVGDEIFPTNEETLSELEENSNCNVEDGLQHLKESKDSHNCRVCGLEVKNGEKLRICGNSCCLNKYHMRCLTNKQLKVYGPCWYCPNCICRVCLTDQDDEKIVICDGCDYGYHIYCMEPPRTSIPKGQRWFCKKCDAEIQEIRKAKKAYEIIGKKHKKELEEGRRAYEKKQKKNVKEVSDKAGVDMLLTAATQLES
ncbi:hypothetical protein L1049_026378 [Liquidambar formosana]|uniref:PHD-type domain-containing protein n=1 Tax=Liquidambar formosana TaxID=63359 RepID=A0AAP0R7Q1_LIQFO